MLLDLLTPSKSGGPRSVLTGTAARIAHCHPATVRRAIERGDLEAFRLGPRGAYRIKIDELHRWARPARTQED